MRSCAARDVEHFSAFYHVGVGRFLRGLDACGEGNGGADAKVVSYRGWGVCLGAVNGDAKFQADLGETVGVTAGVTAMVQFRVQPGGVLSTFWWRLTLGEAKVRLIKVGCELFLGVVGLGAGEDVLDVRVLDAVELGAALGLHDAGFDGRRSGSRRLGVPISALVRWKDFFVLVSVPAGVMLGSGHSRGVGEALCGLLTVLKGGAVMAYERRRLAGGRWRRRLWFLPLFWRDLGPGGCSCGLVGSWWAFHDGYWGRGMSRGVLCGFWSRSGRRRAVKGASTTISVESRRNPGSADEPGL